MAVERDRGRWVIWGVGSPTPERMFDVEVADEEADRIVADHDPGWRAEQGGWSVVVSADEAAIKAWLQTNDSGRGYAAYEGAGGGAPKVERPRPY